MKITHTIAVLRLLAVAVLVSVTLTGPVLAAADADERVIGNRGELLQLRAGTYGELFADGRSAAAGASVLALDVTVGTETERLLVPGTESFLPETSTRLIHDEPSGVSYLLWESLVNGVHPLIHLVAFDGQSWSEVRELTGSVFSDKGHPQLMITRDSYDLGEGESFDRTVLHVFWWEDTASGVEKRYAPVVIENGSFLETQVVRDLSSFFMDSNGGPTFDFAGLGSLTEGLGLEHIVRLQPGPKVEATVLGFLSPEGDKLTSLQIEVLPQELSRLAWEIETGVGQLPESANPVVTEQMIRQTLDEAGENFLPATLQALLDDLLDTLANHEDPDARSLREKLGARAVIVGMKVGANGLEDQRPKDLIEIERGEDFSHHLEVTHLASWPAPIDIDRGGYPENARLFLSRTGTSAMVAWPSEGAVHYRATLSDGTWSEPATLALGEGLDLEGAMNLLENKALAR